MSLYVHRIRKKSIILRDADLSTEEVKFSGTDYKLRTQSNVKFGVLVLQSKTGGSVDHTKTKTKLNESVDGFKIGASPVLHMETKDPIPNLFWVEKA